MNTAQIYLTFSMFLIAGSISEYDVICTEGFGRPRLVDCMVALHRLHDLYPGNTMLRLSDDGYEIVRPRGGPGAPQPQASSSHDTSPLESVPVATHTEDPFDVIESYNEGYIGSTFVYRKISISVTYPFDPLGMLFLSPFSSVAYADCVLLLGHNRESRRCEITFAWENLRGIWPPFTAFQTEAPRRPLVLQWYEVVEASRDIKDKCLLPDRGGTGGWIEGRKYS